MVTAGRRVFYLGDTLVSYEREYVWAHDGVEWVVVVHWWMGMTALLARMR